MMLTTCFRKAEAETAELNAEDPVDYPRPAPPDEQQHQQVHHEDELPKKEKKQQHVFDHKYKEPVYRKVEMINSKPAFGAGGRIGQPAGKGNLI